MEINKLSSNFPASLAAQKSPISSPETSAAPLPKQKDAISEDWQLLEQAEQELATLNDVDMDKVNALRSALSEGRFELDLNDLAQSMLEQHG
ncbi:flagellar biosynthesis anti-sigma factor FlgM [Ferrimonas balearica]|uniref:flagellar biosynthesis anti-sigma factor FlgM n=1 Tax=Ferrimonas balearica TaxID=44012 RepID=UPI001C9A0F4D|nr:flagellar biosynthesis anti-sigma factor FlgM [Ferrimonas balearica]MBY5920014.1 flagellar biosynthesis anti-sigma factor FlgM [Ferrimonas balearica]MBY5997301.1 flagellar biosynthesis anti-sigma factor FlgM [Ferrimonas balearica]